MNAQIVGKQREAARHPVGGRGIDLLAVGVFALALCARLIHIWAISKSPFFDQLLVDSVDFDARAMAFMQGRWLEAGAFFQAPLYPLFLALIYKVFGHSLLAVRLVQAVLGSGTALLVYLVGRRCCGRSVGLVAGLIASLYSMAIHFDAEILRPPLVLFLAVLGLYLLLSAAAKDGLRGWAAAGFILGLASIARPTLLVFLPLAGLWVYFGHGQKGTPGVRNSVPRAAATALFLCCSLVPVGTVTSINYARSGQFVLISYNGGINFYIGNNPDYEATVAIRPGIRWDLLTSEPAADRRTDPSGWSRYYYDKAFHYIESDPEGYAGLVLKKLVLFWNGHEIERNVDFSHVAEYSPFMAHRLVSFVWVAPLALVGMVMAWRKKAPMGLLALYFLSQMAATVAFFVCARYRMIAMPALWVFAAYAGVVLTTTLKRGPITALPYLALVAAAAVGVNYNAYNISDRHYTRPDYELGLIMRREGRTDECLALLRRSEAERPDDPDPPFQRGTTLAGSGRFGEAASAFEEAARREPRYPRTWFNLGLCLGRAGKPADAAGAYRRALDIEPGYWEAWMGLGGALENEGRRDQAADAFIKAAEVAPDRPRAAISKTNLARIEMAAGEYEISLKHLDEAIAMDPSYLDARLGKVRVLRAMGLLDEAEQEARIAVRLAPEDPRVKDLQEELGR